MKKKLKSIKSLKKVAEALWKEVCHLKYGSFCYVQRYYPSLKIRHTEIIQIDHCITRANTYFKFDTKNGLPVCSSCNSAKSNHLKSVERAINEMVEKRDPEWYKNAVWLDQSKEANCNYSKRWWLEEIIEDLEEQKKVNLRGC